MRIHNFHRTVLTALVLMSVAPAWAATRVLGTGDNLQTAIDQAQPGDVILLQPGVTFSGNFVLPAKEGTSYITVRSAAGEASLPAPGTRTSPAFRGAMPRIATPNAEPVLKTQPGAHHWRFECVEFVPAMNGSTGDLIRLGAGETSAAQIPHHFIFDRVLIDVPETVALKRGFALNSGYTTVTNSHISGIKQVGQETQAFAGWTGPGPFDIENNLIEAAGINIMFGGAPPQVPGMVPVGIVLRRNLISKRWSWWSQHPTYGGTRWTVKNFLEIKMGEQINVEGNVFENNWADAQDGAAFVIVAYAEGTTWARTRDITIRNNIVRHVGHGGRVGGGDAAAKPSNISISNNLFYDLDSRYSGGYPSLFLVVTGSDGLKVEHNTVLHNGSVVVADGVPNTNAVFRNNYARHNAYGVFGSGAGIGADMMARYLPGGILTGNVFAGGGELASRYPNGNFFPDLSAFDSSFIDPLNGNYRLKASSPYVRAATDGTAIGVNQDSLESALNAGDLVRPAPPRNLRIVP